jgi:hypothetical protein
VSLTGIKDDAEVYAAIYEQPRLVRQAVLCTEDTTLEYGHKLWSSEKNEPEWVLQVPVPYISVGIGTLLKILCWSTVLLARLWYNNQHIDIWYSQPSRLFHPYLWHYIGHWKTN